jgi:excisionase family DNA binding protein
VSAALLDPEDVAAHLKVTSRAVRKLLERGALKGSKVGRLWRTRQEDVDAYLAANSNQQNVVSISDGKKKATR